MEARPNRPRRARRCVRRRGRRRVRAAQARILAGNPLAQDDDLGRPAGRRHGAPFASTPIRSRPLRQRLSGAELRVAASDAHNHRAGAGRVHRRTSMATHLHAASSYRGPLRAAVATGSPPSRSARARQQFWRCFLRPRRGGGRRHGGPERSRPPPAAASATRGRARASAAQRIRTRRRARAERLAAG